jgi:integrase
MAKTTGQDFTARKTILRTERIVPDIDHDLKFADIAKRDSLNRVIDVHALRHTHATLLAQSGVSPSIAKSTMRIPKSV